MFKLLKIIFYIMIFLAIFAFLPNSFLEFLKNNFTLTNFINIMVHGYANLKQIIVAFFNF